jgi:predicted dehydrogenase
MTVPINWGIISTGDIAKSFAKALKLLPDARLQAVASRNQQTADIFGDKFDVPTRHSSYQALADDPDVDVVYVATPHALHKDNSIMCMKAGKAVLCEKALTINAREAEEMIRVAREQGVFLMEAMITRHLPAIKAIRRWIEDGEIGDVRMVTASRCAHGTFDNNTRHMKRELGGGSLLDVGVYVISFASMVFGRSPVNKTGYAHIGEAGTDEQGGILLTYENGAVAALTFALRTDGTNDAEIRGTEGRIYVNAPFPVATKARLTKPGHKDKAIKLPLTGNGLNYEAEEVMRCMRAGLLESPHMPLDESLDIMHIMDEIRRPWGLVYPNDDQ